MKNPIQSSRAKVQAAYVPIIGIYKTPDATSTLVQSLLTAALRVTSKAKAVEVPVGDDVPPGGFYATPLQSISPALCRDRVVLTQWETDRLLPEHVTLLNTARAVMTISPWCADVFRRSGVRVPVHSFTLGIDQQLFCPDQAILPPIFTFLTAGRNRGDRRKGIENVIAAFVLAFSHDTRACLRIKLGPNDPAPDLTSGRIQYIREHFTPGQLVHLYQTATCYVNGSYGEGFGLHLLEAMACGCPVISTNWGGVSSFLTEDPPNYYRIPHKLVPAHKHFGAGKWAQPDIPEMASAMLTVAANGRRFVCLGESAADSVSPFTTETMLDQMSVIVKRYV